MTTTPVLYRCFYCDRTSRHLHNFSMWRGFLECQECRRYRLAEG